jgi:hypothetical protein
MIELGASIPYAINESGLIVGERNGRAIRIDF